MFIHSFLRVPREVSSRLYCQQFWPDLPWICMCGRKQKRKKAAEIPEEKKKRKEKQVRIVICFWILFIF